MGFSPFSGSGPLQLQAATAAAGFALQNATPTVVTWTAPNDGQVHTVQVIGSELVTSAMTGGAMSLTYTDPGNNSRTNTIDAGGHSTGLTNMGLTPRLVYPGTTVTVAQSSALTVGAATAWIAIWGA